MSSRLIIDGNAVYEIDEDCLKNRREQEYRRRRERSGYPYIQEEKGIKKRGQK